MQQTFKEQPLVAGRWHQWPKTKLSSLSDALLTEVWLVIRCAASGQLHPPQKGNRRPCKMDRGYPSPQTRKLTLQEVRGRELCRPGIPGHERLRQEDQEFEITFFNCTVSSRSTWAVWSLCHTLEPAFIRHWNIKTCISLLGAITGFVQEATPLSLVSWVLF